MVVWILAKKDLRLLLRDARALVILLAMPLIFILVLGVSLGEGFGEKPDDRLRVSLVNLDTGFDDPAQNQSAPFGNETWSEVVQRDLAQTAGLKLEIIPTVAQAENLVARSKRSAVIVFGPEFSRRVARCSFLAEGINPFYRDGIKIARRSPREPAGKNDLDTELIIDPTQLISGSIIEQVAQVTLLRVILPWMIGRAFEKVGEVDFIEKLSHRVSVPVPVLGKVKMDKLLITYEQKEALGQGIQRSIQDLFSKYNLTGKTWATLTRGDPRLEGGAAVATYQEEGAGWLKRGAIRYQLLVPSYLVMFAFFLVLTVGWLFVAERRQGTMKRLRAAPLARWQILLGKFIPCYLLSLFQGFFLLLAGKGIFGMNWGAEPGWLVPVVATTSLAAMGLALLVASLARTETQVAIYGTLLVLVLAGLSGCMMGDRTLMPEQMQHISLITPHAWALEAYKHLLPPNPQPDHLVVAQACGVLTLFGLGFMGIAWGLLKLE